MEQLNDNAPYDSSHETLEHKRQVARFMAQFIHDLYWRAMNHDNTKLESPEKPIFDVVTPKLKELTYGSPEYTE